MLLELVEGVPTLAISIERIEARREFAINVEERTVDAHVAEWQDVAAMVLDDERYGGLSLRPQVGLVPLGPDPASGLQEFAHLQTGSVPTRDALGQLELDGSSGLQMLRWLPGGQWTPTDVTSSSGGSAASLPLGAASTGGRLVVGSHDPAAASRFVVFRFAPAF